MLEKALYGGKRYWTLVIGLVSRPAESTYS